MKVTKEQFEAYEDVRESGVTNMLNVTYVEQLSGLERPVIMVIMKQYTELVEKYLKKEIPFPSLNYSNLTKKIASIMKETKK